MKMRMTQMKAINEDAELPEKDDNDKECAFWNCLKVTHRKMIKAAAKGY